MGEKKKQKTKTEVIGVLNRKIIREAIRQQYGNKAMKEVFPKIWAKAKEDGRV